MACNQCNSAHSYLVFRYIHISCAVNSVPICVQVFTNILSLSSQYTVRTGGGHSWDLIKARPSAPPQAQSLCGYSIQAVTQYILIRHTVLEKIHSEDLVMYSRLLTITLLPLHILALGLLSKYRVKQYSIAYTVVMWIFFINYSTNGFNTYRER